MASRWLLIRLVSLSIHRPLSRRLSTPPSKSFTGATKLPMKQ
jgi:hypothetical protein